MTKVWSPTNLAWIINHILVKSPSDLANVHAIQDKINVKPLSVFQGKTATANIQQPSASTAMFPLPHQNKFQLDLNPI